MKYIEKLSHFLKALVHPYALRDWYIVIVVSLLVLVLLVGISVHFFFGIRSGSIVSTPAPENTRTLSVSREKLQEAVSIFETKQVNYDSGNVRTPDVSDPSR